MNKVKTAIIYHYIAHYRKHIFETLSKESINSNIQYEIFADDKANIDSIKVLNHETDSEKINWYKIRCRWITKDIMWQWGAIKVALSKKYQCIILLGNMYFVSTWIAAIIARLTGKRVLMWTHGTRKKESGIKGIVRRSFYRLAHGLLLYGEWGKSILLESKLNPETLYVVNNSLDYDNQKSIRDNITQKEKDELRRRLHIPNNSHIIISICRLTKTKQLSLLVNAIANTEDIYALIVGDGPDKENLQKLSSSLGIEKKVIFYGSSYCEEDNAKLFSISDLCVIPGDIGLTAMHAMAYGVPVITHNNFEVQGPEFEAIQPDITGDFFQFGNLVDLVRVINKWISTPKSDEKAINCISRIEEKYTVIFQRKIFHYAVLGNKA